MGIQERREREKIQRQQDILDAAEKVFFSKGLSEATMDDVASEAELSKGTLYLYFKSKEDMYLAITSRGLIILEGMFRQAVGKHERGLDQVLILGQAFYEFSLKYPDYFNALTYYELKDLAHEENNEIVRECSCNGQQVLALLIQAIQKGIDDGSIRPDVDPGRMALSMWGMSSGIIQLVMLKGKHLAEDHGFTMEGLVEESYQVFLCALENKQ
ncbi:TetR/AcrR family transcriptional regulator [bacterium]|nr:TetR/AcrR family transcriptional regulator [bacterium]